MVRCIDTLKDSKLQLIMHRFLRYSNACLAVGPGPICDRASLQTDLQYRVHVYVNIDAYLSISRIGSPHIIGNILNG